MCQATFLKSPLSGKNFVGSRSEQQSFSKRLKQLDVGGLTSIQHKLFVEDAPVVVDLVIDDECGLDGEGTGTGSSEDAGGVGGAGDEYAECKMVNKLDEEPDREMNGTESSSCACAIRHCRCRLR